MADNWVTSLLCPILGVTLSNGIMFVPIRAIIRAREQNKMGDLSPVPFAIITISKMGWLSYALFTKNYFIFTSSSFGLAVGFMLCFTSFHLLERPKHHHSESITRILTEGVLMVGICLWMIVWLVVFILIDDYVLDLSILGSFCAASSLSVYTSPLLNLYNIVKTKNSASLSAPFIAINAVGCVMWFAYGFFGLKTVSVWLPNLIGFVINAIQLTLCWRFPALARKNTIVSDNAGEESPAGTSPRYRPRHQTVTERIIDAVIGLPELPSPVLIGSSSNNNSNDNIDLKNYDISDENDGNVEMRILDIESCNGEVRLGRPKDKEEEPLRCQGNNTPFRSMNLNPLQLPEDCEPMTGDGITENDVSGAGKNSARRRKDSTASNNSPRGQ